MHFHTCSHRQVSMTRTCPGAVVWLHDNFHPVENISLNRNTLYAVRLCCIDRRLNFLNFFHRPFCCFKNSTLRFTDMYACMQHYCAYSQAQGQEPYNTATFGKLIRSVFPTLQVRCAVSKEACTHTLFVTHFFPSHHTDSSAGVAG